FRPDGSDDGHFSSRPVARPIERPTRESIVGRTSPAPIFGLAPGGVCRASRSPGCWWALTLRDRSPPTFSPLPREMKKAKCRMLKECQSPNAKYPRVLRPFRIDILLPFLIWHFSFLEAVCFLLHFPYPWPGEPGPWTVGVTHHRVLWSPDFPLPARSDRGEPRSRHNAGSDHPADSRIHFHFIRCF